MIKLKCCIAVLLAVVSTNAYSQLSFHIDDMDLHSISDMEIDYSGRLICESYELILTQGPCLIVNGQLTNNSDEDILVYADHVNPDFYSVADVSFLPTFRYRGKEYMTSRGGGEYRDVFLGHVRTEKYGESYEILVLHKGESIAIKNLLFYFLEDSRFNKIELSHWYVGKGLRHNVRIGRRLEKIAKEAALTMEIKPTVKISNMEIYMQLLNALGKRQFL